MASFVYSVIISLLVLIPLAFGAFPWILGDTTFPGELVKCPALGWDEVNQRIWIVGGYFAQTQCYWFDVHSHEFTQCSGVSVSRAYIIQRAAARYFAQIGDQLYIQNSYNHLVQMDMSTGSYDDLGQIPPTPTPSDYWSLGDSCLEHYNDGTKDYIVAAGGRQAGHPTPFKHTDAAKIYDVAAGSWESLQSLVEILSMMSCNVVDDKLYVIGGYICSGCSVANGDQEYKDYVQLVDLSSSRSSTSLLSQSLFHERYGHSSVLVTDDIMIFGGGGRSGRVHDVEFIDITSNTISNKGAILAVHMYFGGGIIIPQLQKIYQFGGEIASWQYTNASVQIPTNEPSPAPSAAPTLAPSVAPTEAPTAAPSPISVDLCNYVDLEIYNLSGISREILNETFRSFITNVTKYAVHYVGKQNIIENDENSYYTKIEEISGNIRVVQRVYAFSDTIMNVVTSILEDESAEIAAYIRAKLVELFDTEISKTLYDADVTDLTVNISLKSDGSCSDTETERAEVPQLPSLLVGLGIFAAFMFFAFVSVIDAKVLRKSDYLQIMNIVTAAIEVQDTTLDLLFAVFLTMTYSITPSRNLFIATVASYAFVVIPIGFSIMQLINKSRKTWLKDDHLRRWMTDRGKFLYLMSVLFGSSYTAIEIVNCNALQIDLFCMGLTKKQRIEFNTKRIWGVVCLENIPQTCIQIWYLSTIGLDYIPLFSIIFAFITISMNILGLFTQRSILRNQQLVVIGFNVIGADVTKKLGLKTNDIRAEIAEAVAMHERLIEIPRPVKIAKGLKFEIYLYLNVKYENKLTADGLSAIIMQKWSIKKPKITELKVANVVSRNQQKSINATPAAGASKLELLTSNYREKTPGAKTEQLEVVLLEKWKLKMYWDSLKTFGYDEAADWKDLICDDAEMTKVFKVKSGHKNRFIKNVKEYNQKNNEEGDVAVDIMKLTKQQKDKKNKNKNKPKVYAKKEEKVPKKVENKAKVKSDEKRKNSKVKDKKSNTKKKETKKDNNNRKKKASQKSRKKSKQYFD